MTMLERMAAYASIPLAVGFAIGVVTRLLTEGRFPGVFTSAVFTIGGAIGVIVISLAVITFAWRLCWRISTPENGAPMAFAVVATIWVGYTGARLVHAIAFT